MHIPLINIYSTLFQSQRCLSSREREGEGVTQHAHGVESTFNTRNVEFTLNKYCANPEERE